MIQAAASWSGKLIFVTKLIPRILRWESSFRMAVGTAKYRPNFSLQEFFSAQKYGKSIYCARKQQNAAKYTKYGDFLPK
jgi:hypothetical protein